MIQVDVALEGEWFVRTPRSEASHKIGPEKLMAKVLVGSGCVSSPVDFS
jgi:hypothetical protein